MSLKKTTVMVDEDDLLAIKEAAAREGRTESEYFREAFHIAALRTRRWDEDGDIPQLDFGGPVSAEEIHRSVSDAMAESELSSSAPPPGWSRPSTRRTGNTRGHVQGYGRRR
ncbi:CopG family transcriptional regulator [Streptomyces chumphonensis]|uniref:CopG family transcriptional regulator n=1 Tax=Streptomyces chumphonensis TaxID=1214925 RepID=UPI001CD14E6A|nr:CopG family transcriptional regulator [Streptomyces chumphonensis]